MSVLNEVLLLLKKEEEQLQRELSGITAAISAFGKTYVNGKSPRRISAAVRPRMAAAHSARGTKPRKTGKIVPMKSKRTLSAAAKKRVPAAQKAKWARIKAAKTSA
jgi:hypothetical protein